MNRAKEAVFTPTAETVKEEYSGIKTNANAGARSPLDARANRSVSGIADFQVVPPLEMTAEEEAA